LGCLKLPYQSVLKVHEPKYFLVKSAVEKNDHEQKKGVSSFTFGFQGQEGDDEVNSIAFKYRFHDPRLGRFLSIDPLFKEYAHNSPYAFSENRVNDAIELEGAEAFPIHGTWGDNRAWSSQLMDDLTSTFGNNEYSIREDPDLIEQSWSGGNADKYRRAAAAKMVKYVKENRVPGEPITLIGHSHGGNVAIMAMNTLVEDPDFADAEFNLLTMNTPVREYQLSETALGKVNHYHVYNNKDRVQNIGGNTVKRFLGDGLKKFLNALPSGELGKAGRTFESAQNIEYKSTLGGIEGGHQSWNKANVNDWVSNLEKTVNPSPTKTGGSGMGAIESGDNLDLGI
jgi:RHS repeat-associated protein